ncbi:MAG TPA: 3-hydroxyacyl-CoA dehydrogenase NAD-binding domain-containing protein [Rubrivivax sp.]|nr:3-hydroxyacyl-CoA dehydrogenase NAD-binding domain-containing protein [Rubrivivax sp.]
MSSVRYELRGHTALITLDNPPVNGLGAALRSGIMQALDQALADAAVQAIVITGSERAFSGGADVKEFGTPLATQEPRLPAVIAALEGAAKPVIAAISGVCMGGGLELALGAHYRVARADAQLALPEVKLGLMPGAGGTQRLPRAIGLQRALEMIVTGATAKAEKFQGSALLDAIAEGDSVAAALELAHRIVTQGLPRKRLRDIAISDPGAQAALQAMRESVAKTSRFLPAPGKCIDAVEMCLTTPFDEALARERETFLALLGSPEARALRHIFTAERAAAKVPGIPEGTALRPIARVGVIGAGTMGAGIAMNFLSAGIPVVLLEMKQEALDRGVAAIRRNYEGTVKKGRLTNAQLEANMERLTPTLAYDGLRDVDLVIEAVFENLEVKRQVFTTLDDTCKPGAILASNTSYLNIDSIAGFTRRPQDVLGLHFFSPANVMRLLEVVRGAKTAPDVLATCMALAKKIGKMAIVSGVCDGFIGNRMLARYNAAVAGLIAAGASPQQLDGALQAFGMAMGPCRVGDLAGLDIGWATRKRRAEEAGVPFVPIIADKLCEAGRFGQKTGAGWYRYEAGSREPIPDPVTQQIIDAYRAERGIVPRAVSDAEIVERCMFALANEGARILEEGIAARASDIDLVYLNGYGFPRHRGGPMFNATLVGLPEVVKALQRFAAEPGAEAFWQPAPLLLELAAEGKGFS